MLTRSTALCAVVTAAALGGLAVSAPSAQALTVKECSAKYQEAKTAGTLKGSHKWIEKGGGYYSECNKQLKG